MKMLQSKFYFHVLTKSRAPCSTHQPMTKLSLSVIRDLFLFFILIQFCCQLVCLQLENKPSTASYSKYSLASLCAFVPTKCFRTKSEEKRRNIKKKTKKKTHKQKQKDKILPQKMKQKFNNNKYDGWIWKEKVKKKQDKKEKVKLRKMKEWKIEIKIVRKKKV